MKKLYVIIVCILVVSCILFLFSSKKNNLYPNYKIVDYKLEGKNLRLLVADSKEKREKGLMNYRTLPEVDGMLFIFPAKEFQTFWNESTYLDLELYWIDGDRVIGESKLPSIEKTKEPMIIGSPAAVDKVVELEKTQ